MLFMACGRRAGRRDAVLTCGSALGRRRVHAHMRMPKAYTSTLLLTFLLQMSASGAT